VRYAKIISTTGTWIIGDDTISRGPGSRYIVDIQSGFSQYVQSIPYLDNFWVRHLPLGNRNIFHTFLTEYEFNDEAECFGFVAGLATMVPASGTLMVGNTGHSTAAWVYPGSVVVSARRAGDIIGVSVRVLYELVSGRPN
jgi:hypothetical protein